MVRFKKKDNNLVFEALKKVNEKMKEVSFETLFEQYQEMDIRFNNQDIDGILQKVYEKRFVFLVGESGVGKTYAIYRIMKKCLAQTKVVPISLSAEVFGRGKEVTLEGLIKQSYMNILTELEIEVILSAIAANEEVLILIDGIKEVDINLQYSIMRVISAEINNNNRMAVVSGQKLLEEILDIRIKNRMYIMEVTQDSIHKEILKFAYRYLENEPERIKKLDYIEKIDNTLIGVLIVYYLKKSSQSQIKLNDLFKDVIMQILSFRAGTVWKIERSVAVDFLSDLVYWHYMNSYQMTKSSIIMWHKCNKDKVDLGFKNKADFFEWIFEESIFYVSDENIKLMHEKLGDFLIAYKIFNALNFEEYSELVNLKIFERDITIKISSFLTDFLQYKKITSNFKRNLRKIYDNSRKEDLTSGIIYRQQAAFYLGVIGEKIEEIYDDSLTVKRAHIVGMAISGYDMNGFKKYCKELVNSQKETDINLCYTLIHQGDHYKYDEKHFEIFEMGEIQCENAFKGMIKQLLKQEYSRIDILAIITINDYYSMFNEQINAILNAWYNWNNSIKNALKQSINKLENLYKDEKEMFKEILEFRRNILKDNGR